MKKVLACLGAVAVALAITYKVCDAAVQASIERYYQTGTNTEAYNLDGSGNQRIAGWNAVAGSQTVTGAASVGGALAVTGAITNTGTFTASGPMVLTPTAFGGGQTSTFAIMASSVIPYTSAYMVIQTSASTKMTALPAISTNVVAGLSGVGGTGGAIADGSYVVIGTTATSITIRLQSNAGLSGTLLDLAGFAATEIVTSSCPVSFIFNAGTGHWSQISPLTGL